MRYSILALTIIASLLMGPAVWAAGDVADLYALDQMRKQEEREKAQQAAQKESDRQASNERWKAEQAAHDAGQAAAAAADRGARIAKSQRRIKEGGGTSYKSWQLENR